MQYAINYSSKTSHIVFTENICLKKTNKTKKNKWLLENRILILTPPRRLQQSEKFLYIKQKLESKWDEIMIVIFQEKKSEQKQIDGEYFFVSVHAVY